MTTATSAMPSGGAPTFCALLREQADLLRKILEQIDLNGIPASVLAEFEAFDDAHRAWVSSGAHDDLRAHAVEQQIDRVRSEIGSLAATGYLERDPTEGSELLTAEERVQLRRLEKGRIALPAILGGTGQLPVTVPSGQTPAIDVPPGRVAADGGEERARHPVSVADLLRGGRSLRVSPQALHPYAENEDLLARANTSDEKVVRQDILANGIERSVLATGNGCASPPFTILGGHFRTRVAREEGFADVPVLVIDHLDKVAELALLARDNLLDEKRRELTPSARHRLERLAAAELPRCTKVDDARVDVNTKTEPREPSGARAGRRTRTRVAETTGAPANAVADRAKIFDSAVSTAGLKKAVDDGIVSLSLGAALVRAAEKSGGGSKKLRALVVASGARGSDVPAALREARDWVDAQVERVRTGAHLTVREVARAVNHEEVGEDWVELRVALKRCPGGRAGLGTLDGRSYRFLVKGDQLQLGRAPAPNGLPPDPEGAST